MSKQDSIRAYGQVTEALGGERFRVEVELSPYDLSRGRISWRK